MVSETVFCASCKGGVAVRAIIDFQLLRPALAETFKVSPRPFGWRRFLQCQPPPLSFSGLFCVALHHFDQMRFLFPEGRMVKPAFARDLVDHQTRKFFARHSTAYPTDVYLQRRPIEHRLALDSFGSDWVRYRYFDEYGLGLAVIVNPLG